MMYNYETEKKGLFTEENQKTFLTIRDKVYELCKLAGCCRMQEAMRAGSGSSWILLACVDRLVELGEIIEIVPKKKMAGQHRVFMLNKWD